MTENHDRGARSTYLQQVAQDEDLRLAVHEMRKVSRDVARYGDDEKAKDAAQMRYARVAGWINSRVFEQVREWMAEVHGEGALVMALGTSGVDFEYEAVEIVEVVLMDHNRDEVYRTRVRPAGTVTGGHIHGHTGTSLEDAPTFPEIVEDFRRAVDGRRVVAYNAPWAARVLAFESERHGVENPLPGLGIDDCVMSQRSRYAAYYRVTGGDYRPLKLGSPDATPVGVARTVCDVVEAYRTSSRYSPPETPYDPYEDEHGYGWRDAQKKPPDEGPARTGGCKRDDVDLNEEDFDDIAFRARFPARVRYPLAF